MSIIKLTDSYKFSHFRQYPEGTTKVFSYIESRGKADDFMVNDNAETVFFGLQYFLKKYLSKPITKAEVEKYGPMAVKHGVPFNYEGFMYIVEKHGGRLPIEIRAVPEGTPVSKKNVLCTVVNTDDNCAWLTSFVETALLRTIWYPVTVSTLSRETKKLIWKYLEKTCDNPASEINFRLHDFAARGVSSHESAEIGGAAHLVNFLGTDTFECLDFLEEYYDATETGYSIPASEHSTMTILGPEGELSQMERMVDEFADSGIFACVSDSYSFTRAVTEYWPSLKEKIVDKGATLVVRPDSGDPVECVIFALENLSESFGYTINSKGFKVLKNVRVIQGDGIDYAVIQKILEKVAYKGFSVENVAFGMGGGLLQKVNRDSLKFAMKASAAEINGKWYDVFKSPEGAEFKASKKGRLNLVNISNGHLTVREDSPENVMYESALKKVFENGKIIEEYTFDEVRKNAKI